MIVRCHIKGTDESVLRRMNRVIEALGESERNELELNLEITETAEEMLCHAAVAMADEPLSTKARVISIADLEAPTLDLRDDDEPAVFLGSIGILPEVAERIANGILAKVREHQGEGED